MANIERINQGKDFPLPAKEVAQAVQLYAREYKLVPGIHIIYMGANPYITSDGLLWLGNNHPDENKRIAGIRTDIVSADFEKNIFIVKAVVVLNNGQQYEGIGTATRENLTKITQNHGLEMAETRAVSRALRKAYAIGLPAIEELEEKPHNTQKTPKKISEPQRKRLWAIAKQHSVSEAEVKEIIAKYGYESTADITVEDYDSIIAEIEAQAEKEPDWSEEKAE